MTEFTEVFSSLTAIMRPYAEQLRCTADNETDLSLETTFIQKNKSPLWFGGVQMKKNYVSYHLMPVYINPALLDSISPALKKRMQGKSCFNFKAVEPALLEELAALTEAGFQEYKAQGYV